MLRRLIIPANLTQFEGDGGAMGDSGQAGTQPANIGAGNGEGQTADVQGVQTAQNPEDLKKEYQELIKGKFKDIHTQEFKKHLNRRLGDQKKLTDELESHRGLIDLVSLKYGESDIGELMKLVESDNHLLEQRAYEKGIPVETLIEMEKQEMNLRKIKAEAERERYLRMEMERQQSEREQYGKWLRDAEQIKQTNPNFDLNVEVENKQFVALLQCGIDMQHAYNVIHMNEIVNNTAKNAMLKSASAVSSTIAARGQRPPENAGSSNSSVAFKRDVHSFTAKDREDIARRVARGEKISF